MCAQGDPVAIIDKLNNEINSVVALPDMKKRLLDLGVRPIAMTPVAFRKFVAEETEKWANVIKLAGIKQE